MTDDTRDRAIDYLLDVFTDGGVENSRAAIDAITEHVKAKVEQARKFRQAVCGIVPDEEYTHRPESMRSASAPPEVRVVGQIDAKALASKCYGEATSSLFKRYWCGKIKKTSEPDLPSSVCNAMQYHIELALTKSQTALADEVRRLVEARMPTVEHLQEHFCFYDGHGQQSAISDARAYIRDRLLGTDAAEGGAADG